MKKFSLRELRNDMIDHVDLPESLLNSSSFWSTVWIDWMLIQMIGIDAYELMSARHSNYKYYVDYAELWIADQDTGHTIWLG
jgi:hypothetical protein